MGVVGRGGRRKGLLKSKAPGRAGLCSQSFPGPRLLGVHRQPLHRSRGQGIWVKVVRLPTEEPEPPAGAQTAPELTSQPAFPG